MANSTQAWNLLNALQQKAEALWDNRLNNVGLEIYPSTEPWRKWTGIYRYMEWEGGVVHLKKSDEVDLDFYFGTSREIINTAKEIIGKETVEHFRSEGTDKSYFYMDFAGFNLRLAKNCFEDMIRPAIFQKMYEANSHYPYNVIHGLFVAETIPIKKELANVRGEIAILYNHYYGDEINIDRMYQDLWKITIPNFNPAFDMIFWLTEMAMTSDFKGRKDVYCTKMRGKLGTSDGSFDTFKSVAICLTM